MSCFGLIFEQISLHEAEASESGEDVHPQRPGALPLLDDLRPAVSRPSKKPFKLNNIRVQLKT